MEYLMQGWLFGECVDGQRLLSRQGSWYYECFVQEIDKDTVCQNMRKSKNDPWRAFFCIQFMFFRLEILEGKILLGWSSRYICIKSYFVYVLL